MIKMLNKRSVEEMLREFGSFAFNEEGDCEFLRSMFDTYSKLDAARSDLDREDEVNSGLEIIRSAKDDCLIRAFVTVFNFGYKQRMFSK